MLTDARSIRIKGRSFLAVVLAPDLPVDDWLQRLDSLASRSAGFFLGRPVVLDVSELAIDRSALKDLIAALADRNVSIMGLEGAKPSMVERGMPPILKGGRPVSDVDVPRPAKSIETDETGDTPVAPVGAPAPASADPVRTEAERSKADRESPASPAVVEPQRTGGASLVISEPVRSGQSVIFPEGDVTVIGSVASGAEVIAGGSVHVYGAIRGRVMAGCVGNGQARIFCRKLEGELLAIDGIYAMADNLPEALLGQPAQLWLEGDEIKVEKLV